MHVAFYGICKDEPIAPYAVHTVVGEPVVGLDMQTDSLHHCGILTNMNPHVYKPAVCSHGLSTPCIFRHNQSSIRLETFVYVWLRARPKGM